MGWGGHWAGHELGLNTRIHTQLHARTAASAHHIYLEARHTLASAAFVVPLLSKMAPLNDLEFQSVAALLENGSTAQVAEAVAQLAEHTWSSDQAKLFRRGGLISPLLQLLSPVALGTLRDAVKVALHLAAQDVQCMHAVVYAVGGPCAVASTHAVYLR